MHHSDNVYKPYVFYESFQSFPENELMSYDVYFSMLANILKLHLIDFYSMLLYNPLSVSHSLAVNLCTVRFNMIGAVKVFKNY